MSYKPWLPISECTIYTNNDLKCSLPDKLVKRVNRNLQVDNADPEDDNDDYSSDEYEYDDELPI